MSHESTHTDPDPLDQRLRGLLGRVIGDRYEVRSVLATGGMATVFVARHLPLGRDVALKVLCPVLAEQGSYTRRFEREAHSLSRLDHPNCLRVLDYYVTDDGLHVLVTELIDGVELAELMEHPMAPEVAVARAQQILAGLQHAHDVGVVHRDLKPENILVTRDAKGREHLRIVDFGIAKLLGPEGNIPLTATGLVFGTPHYMSPEQASGAAVDHRSDLYAVGVLLYAMLSGQRPFTGDPATIVRAHIEEPPRPLPASVPAPLASVVMQLLSKDPAERFASARAASWALGTAVDDDSDVTKQVTVPRPVTHPVRKDLSRWHAPIVAGAAAAFLGVVAVAVFVDPPPPTEPTERLREHDSDDVRRLLGENRPADAHALAAVLIDEEPEDAELLWLDGKALTALGDHAAALQRYGDALVADEDLRDDGAFVSELDPLMRHPPLRARAIDLALQRMGHAGDEFLLEQINRRDQPLDYVDRHRILSHLEGEEQADRIDHGLAARLDLGQAADAPEPCFAYLHGLQALTVAVPPAQLGVVEAVPVPAHVEGEDPATCAEAQRRRRDVLEARDTIADLEAAIIASRA